MVLQTSVVIVVEGGGMIRLKEDVLVFVAMISHSFACTKEHISYASRLMRSLFVQCSLERSMVSGLWVPLVSMLGGTCLGYWY